MALRTDTTPGASVARLPSNPGGQRFPAGSMRRWLVRGGLMLVFLMLSVSVADACPTCKDSLTADPATSNMVRGYFWSICFMMAMPFVIFGSLGAYFYYEIRRARARQAAGVGSNSQLVSGE